MNLLLVNALSVALSLVSVAIVVVALRKAAEMIRLGRAMAGEITKAASGLENALAALRTEHDDLRDEGRKLNARLQDSAKAQREITRSLDLMARIRTELQGDVRALRMSVTTPAVAPQPPLAATVQAKPSKLPVFVRQRVSNAAHS